MLRLRAVRSGGRIRERGQMSRYSRWNELLELLAGDGQLQVERAAQVLGVSAATVRRDFDELARQQMLTRIRGGAVAQGVTYDLPLRYKTERHPTEKQRIAAAAATSRGAPTVPRSGAARSPGSAARRKTTGRSRTPGSRRRMRPGSARRAPGGSPADDPLEPPEPA